MSIAAEALLRWDRQQMEEATQIMQHAMHRIEELELELDLVTAERDTLRQELEVRDD